MDLIIYKAENINLFRRQTQHQNLDQHNSPNVKYMFKAISFAPSNPDLNVFFETKLENKLFFAVSDISAC